MVTTAPWSRVVNGYILTKDEHSKLVNHLYAASDVADERADAEP